MVYGSALEMRRLRKGSVGSNPTSAATNMQYTESDKARFWAKVEVRSDDECWPWKANLINGYGQFNMGGKIHQKKMVASRVSWELVNGDIHDGLHVLHKCDNPPCCNPKHLFLGTHDVNMKDMKAKGRAKRTDGNAKLNFQVAEQIRADKRPYSVLVDVYGVTKSVISYIKNNRIWIAENRI